MDWEAPVGGGEDNGEKGANIQQRRSQQSVITDINFLFRAFYLFIHLFIYGFFGIKHIAAVLMGDFYSEFHNVEVEISGWVKTREYEPREFIPMTHDILLVTLAYTYEKKSYLEMLILRIRESLKLLQFPRTKYS